MSKLRLGPIVEEKPVKLTVELPGALFRMLGEYAREHARATDLAEPLPPERLVAPMLERFMVTDRAFARRRKA
ncbi:DUF2274 domain-containing protein [Sphingomonas fennica]|uniref:DUF2274 domain-containing protein n=1 Tax=Edaphosphingomonas fennica TaxID=114404 RepID=A0A2T4I5J4_9SPHN|nr:DUF2274 domain-containing protein [Sphingomonas fennica]PTD25491.1 DUF2274 domain-containing protein [Sphingomonas fennica]